MDFWFVWEVIVNLITIAPIHYLFYKQLGVVPARKKFIPLVLAFSVVFISVLNYINIQAAIPVASGLTIYATRILFTLVSALFVFLLCQGNLSEKITWLLVPTFIVAIADFTSILVLSCIGNSGAPSLFQLGMDRFFASLIFVVVILLSCSIIANLDNTKRKLRLSIPSLIRILLIIVLFFGIISVDVLIDNLHIIAANGASSINVGDVVVAASFLLIIFFAFLLVTKVGVLSYENMEYELERQKEKVELAHLQNMELVLDEIRETKHDLRNHLYTMQVMLANRRYDELAAYFNTTNGILDEKTNVVLTKNIPLNSIIYSKTLMMKANQISFHPALLDTSVLPIAEFDLCSILGNLLDNAIEACQNVEEDKRYISFTMKRMENNLVIQIENPYHGTIQKTPGGRYISGKQESGHGLGISHVTRLIHQYGGNILIQTAESLFIVTVLLPYKEGR